MARRATRAAPIAPVRWRDGVHLSGTPIWCDAQRRRDICFVSSVDRLRTGGGGGGATRPPLGGLVDRAVRSGHGHGQLIGTPLTLALLAAKGDGELAVPVRQRFTLGTLRLELIPSGRGLGAAALHADIAGRTVLYAGAVRTTAGGAGEPAEVRACDALVVGAPFGEPRHTFPPLARVIDETIAWVRAQLTAGRRPVLFVDTVIDGLEVASKLGAAGLAVAAGRPIRTAALRAAAHAPVASLPALGGFGRELRATVWLDADHRGLVKAIAAAARSTGFATALVSGRAVDGVTGYDAAFAWASAADRAQLLGWIESTNARHVYVTGACAESIAEVLGSRARVLGPPRQMALFAP